MAERYDLIREESFELYRRAAERFTESGIGEYSVRRADQQIDQYNNPIEMEGIIRIHETGEGDWIEYWRLTEDVEFILDRLKSEDPEADLDNQVDSAISIAITTHESNKIYEQNQNDRSK